MTPPDLTTIRQNSVSFNIKLTRISLKENSTEFINHLLFKDKER